MRELTYGNCIVKRNLKTGELMGVDYQEYLKPMALDKAIIFTSKMLNRKDKSNDYTHTVYCIETKEILYQHSAKCYY